MRNEQDYSDRTLFYWAKLYTSDLKSGDDYIKAKKAIAVNIINFNMFDTDNYHNEIQTVIKETGKVFSDKFSIHFFELKKVSKRLNPSNRRDLWMQFLNADREEEFELIKLTDTVMEKAVNVIYDMSEDTRLREAARLREKIMRDEASALGFAERKGLEKGRKEGLEKGRREGLEKGIKEGLEKGKEEERNKMIKALQAEGYTEEQIKGLLKRFEQ